MSDFIIPTWSQIFWMQVSLVCMMGGLVLILDMNNILRLNRKLDDEG